MGQAEGCTVNTKTKYFEMRIPTDPEIPTHRICSYSQAVPKVDFIYKEIELMDGHIIEPCGSKRPLLPSDSCAQTWGSPRHLLINGWNYKVTFKGK